MNSAIGDICQNTYQLTFEELDLSEHFQTFATCLLPKHTPVIVRELIRSPQYNQQPVKIKMYDRKKSDI